MTVFYLETSALLKRYKTEAGTEAVKYLFSQKGAEDVFVTSYFTTVEVEAAAARARKAHAISETGYRALLGLFTEDLTETIVLQPISNALVSESSGLVKRYALRAGDAIHLAAASRVREAARIPTILVTSDREILNAALKEGFLSFDPQHPDAVDYLRSLTG